MVKRFIWLMASLLLVPAVAGAVENASFTTIIRFEQRDYPGIGKKTIVPATEFVRLDADKLADGNLSFHLYGWERLDLADSSSAGGVGDGNLSYGYLAYRLPHNNADVRAGRFFLYEGVAVEQIDGLAVRADLPKGFTASLFAGIPVGLDRKNDNRGDYIVGGRGSYRRARFLEVGLSGLCEGGVVTGTVGDAKDYRQMVGLDLWLNPLPALEINGHTFLNGATGGLAEHSYLLSYALRTDLLCAVGYDEQDFGNYFAATNLVAVTDPAANPNAPFNPNAGGGLKSYGVTAHSTFFKPLELTAELKRYNRQQRGDAYLVAAEARLALLDKKSRSGFSYQRLAASGSITSFHELRGYTLYDAGRYFGSLDVMARFYDEGIFTENQTREVTLSGGWRLGQELALSGDMGIGSNPFYRHELRLLLKLTYALRLPHQGGLK